MTFSRQMLALGYLLHVSTALRCKSNIDSKGQVGPNEVSKDCAAEGSNSCFTFTLVDEHDTQKVLWTLKGCQTMSAAELHCLRYHQSVDTKGNCLEHRQLQQWWILSVNECSGKDDPEENAVGQEHFVYMCTCNHEDDCNENCQCDPTFGLCGRNLCPTYKCYCSEPGISPNFPGECDSKGEKECLGNGSATGCYFLAQEGPNPHVYRDCALPAAMVNCIHGKGGLKKADGPGDCVTGTNDDWHGNARGYCGWKEPQQTVRQLPNEDRGARIKACRCTGEYCNRAALSWEPDKKSKTAVDAGDKSGGKGTPDLSGALMMAMVTAARLLWNGF